MANPQPQPPATGAFLPETARELRRSGLTVNDIAMLFGIHPRAVSDLLNDRASNENTCS